jgi:uncharacterized protein with PIN domain
MILDSSPLVAILAEEADAELYIQAISRAPRCRISAGNFIELSIVIESQLSALRSPSNATHCFAALALRSNP